MLSRLLVKNFKSIGEKGIDLELKPLTLLIGPNGSGKSSILESIALQSQSVHSNDLRLQGDLVQFTGLEDIACRHNLAQWITWEVHFREGSGYRSEYKLDTGEDKETVIQRGQDLVQLALEGDRQIGYKLRAIIPGQPPIETGYNVIGKFHPAVFKDISKEKGKGIPAFDEAYAITNEVASYLRERVFLLAGLRGNVASQASTGGRQAWPKWVGKYGEDMIPILSHISNTSAYESAWNNIEHWAGEFGLLKLKAGIRGVDKLAADFMDPELKVAINLAFAGQGSRQIASVITQLFWSRPDSLIMIEEPEISLHPEAQVKLGELFADAIKEDKQIIATTHSHFLLLALSRAVEKGLKVEDIAVYHVTKDKEGTEAKPVKLSKRGYPLGWPPSYEKVEKELAFNWAKELAE